MDSNGATVIMGSAGADRSGARPSADARAELDASYRACYPGLVAEQHAIRGDQRQARAAVHEAIRRAWRRWSTVRTLPDPAGWIAGCARHIPDAPRRSRPLGRRSERPAPLLLEALGQVPDVQRRALVLHHLSGLPAHAVAETEGAPLATIQVRLAHGRLALARRLDELAAIAAAGLEPARWTSGPLEDWAAARLTQLGRELTPSDEIPPLATVLAGSLGRRRAIRAGAGALIGAGALGLALASAVHFGVVNWPVGAGTSAARTTPNLAPPPATPGLPPPTAPAGPTPAERPTDARPDSPAPTGLSPRPDSGAAGTPTTASPTAHSGGSRSRSVPRERTDSTGDRQAPEDAWSDDPDDMPSTHEPDHHRGRRHTERWPPQNPGWWARNWAPGGHWYGY